MARTWASPIACWSTSLSRDSTAICLTLGLGFPPSGGPLALLMGCKHEQRQSGAVLVPPRKPILSARVLPLPMGESVPLATPCTARLCPGPPTSPLSSPGRPLSSLWPLLGGVASLWWRSAIATPHAVALSRRNLLSLARMRMIKERRAVRRRGSEPLYSV